MAPLNDELREIKAQSKLERQALFEPVSEISRRLQPRYLVDVTTQYAKDKVAAVVGGVSDTIKENGGTAAAIALGAVAVFDVGRRSVEGRTRLTNSAAEPGTPDTDFGRKDPGGATIAYLEPPRKTVTNQARAKMIAGSIGGLLLGHVIGRSVRPSAKERELFGKASGEVQDAASKFVEQHLHGAKLVAAQAFGFARYSAAFLAIMAAVSDHLVRSADGGDPPPADP
jgi:hypothetical protein